MILTAFCCSSLPETSKLVLVGVSIKVRLLVHLLVHRPLSQHPYSLQPQLFKEEGGERQGRLSRRRPRQAFEYPFSQRETGPKDPKSSCHHPFFSKPTIMNARLCSRKRISPLPTLIAPKQSLPCCCQQMTLSFKLRLTLG